MKFQSMSNKYDVLKGLRMRVDITVPTLLDLYAIKTYRRKWGMVVAVYGEESTDDADGEGESKNGLYQLVFGHNSEIISDNLNWVHIDSIIDVYVRDHGVYAAYEYLMKERIFGNERVTLIKKPSGVLSGGLVSYEGDGLKFLVSDVEFLLQGKFYEASLGLASPYVTLAPADPIYSRIDIIAVRSMGIEEDSDVLQGEIVVVTGEAGAYPAKPTIGDDHLELTQLLLPAGALAYDMYVTEDVIYDENVEWATSVIGGCTADFADPTTPHRGAVCAKITRSAIPYPIIQFQRNIALDLTGYGVVSVWFRLGQIVGTGEEDRRLRFDFGVGANVLDYGYQGDTLEWQNIQVSIRDFEMGQTERDALQITIDGLMTGQVVYFDYIKLAGGIAQPVSSDQIRLVGDVVGEGKVGEEIETALTVVADGGTKGGTGKSLEITYDSKGRILSVEEFSITGADEVRFRVEGGMLQYTYDIDADYDADVDGYGWTDMVAIPPDTQLDFVDGQILYRYVPVGVDETTVMWDVLVDLEVFVNNLLADSDADFDDTHITGFAAAVEAGTPPTVGNDDTISLTITDSKGATYKVTLGGHAALIPWHGTQAEYDAIVTKNSNTIYYINEA